jgi:hypothetical protein
MFHNLGRLLSQYYFPEESSEIRRVLLQKNCSEDAAALQVLGISFEDLASVSPRTGVSASDRQQHAPAPGRQHSPFGQPRRSPARSLGIVERVVHGDRRYRSRSAAKELRRIAMRFGDAVALDEEELRRSVDKSLQQVAQFARSIQLNLQQTRFGRQLKAWGGAAERCGGGDDGVRRVERHAACRGRSRSRQRGSPAR